MSVLAGLHVGQYELMLRAAIRVGCLFIAVASFLFGLWVKVIFGAGTSHLSLWRSASLVLTLVALGVVVLLDRREADEHDEWSPKRSPDGAGPDERTSAGS